MILTTKQMIGNIAMNGIALHKNNLFNGLPVAQSLTGFLRGFFMDEVWKDIPDCQGYKASNLGNIMNINTGNVLKHFINKQGYSAVSVIENSKRRTMRVNRLVCYAFHGKNTDMLVLHNNGNPQDNSPENLRYGTYKDNYMDAVTHKTNSKGHVHGRSKIKQENIKDIINEYNAGGISFGALGVKYGVSAKAISLIVKRVNWKWVNINE